jgi:hypothetical protein
MGLEPPWSVRIVLLHLPEPYHPDEFLPEIPFFPM